MQPFTFFISYRRRDTAPIALLLKNEIEKRLRFVRVLVDVEDIRPGDEFPKRIEHMIEGAHATIALIGERWMSRVGEAAPRNETDVDWVEEELEYSRNAPLPEEAHGRTGRDVIPLFVDCRNDFEQFVLPTGLEYMKQLHAESIDHASWPRNIAPLVDRIAGRFELETRPDKQGYPEPDPGKARTQAIPDSMLAVILEFDDYAGWYVDNFGNSEARYLTRMFEFANFGQAADFMSRVSDHCRVLKHHPEWRNVFNHVTVALTTWDARQKITIYDLNLALFMSMVARDVLEG